MKKAKSELKKKLPAKAMLIVYNAHDVSVWICRDRKTAADQLLAFVAWSWDKDVNQEQFSKVPSDADELVDVYMELTNTSYEIFDGPFPVLTPGGVKEWRRKEKIRIPKGET